MQGQTRRAAVGFMLGAGALVAATSLLAKSLGLAVGEVQGLHPLQVSAGRFGFALVALMIFVLLRPTARPSFGGARLPLHLARSVCGWLGVTAMFAAVATMPVAEATAISFLNPLVTMLLAAFLLGDRPGVTRLSAAALAVLGVLLILRPGTDAFQIAGVYALAAAGFMGIEALFIKRLSDTEPALRILIINNTIGAVVSGTVAVMVWQWPVAGQWLQLAALGAIMVCAQAMFIQSMKRGEASLVMPAFYSVLVFAAVYDFVLYGVRPDAVAALGAALVISGALILILREGRGRRSRGNNGS